MREQHFFDQNVLLQDEMNMFMSPRDSMLSSTSSEGTTGSGGCPSTPSLAKHFKKNLVKSTLSGSSSDEKIKKQSKEVQGLQFE